MDVARGASLPDVQAPSDASRAQAARLTHDRGTVFALTIGLALICLLVKIALLPFPVETVGEFVRWLLRLAIVYSADACFVFGLGLTCWLFTRVAAANRWSAVLWRIALLAIYLLAGVYAVASHRVFQVTSEMITYRLLAFLGHMDVMASSLWSYVNGDVIRGLILVPIVLLLGFFVGNELRWVRRAGAVSAKPLALAAVLVLLYGGVCKAYVHYSWTEEDRWERRISANPHATFLYSWVRELVVDDSLPSLLAMEDADESDIISPRNEDADEVAPALPPNVAPPKNVLMIVMESVSAEYLGLYGAKYDTTPQLQRYLAQNGNGIVFDNFYIQCPYSCKSLVSITTGVYPRPDWGLIVRDNPNFQVPLLSEWLTDRAGFRSCYLHAGYWSWKHRDGYFGRRPDATLIDAETLPGPFVNSWGVTDAAMYSSALDWIAESDKPFFAMAFTIETHHPYVGGPNPLPLGPEHHDEEATRMHNRYLNAIRNADQQIVDLLEELKRRKLDESTLVVILGDHGEFFGQHNQWLHGYSVYNTAVQVPLIMIHPSLQQYPRRIEQPCQAIDLPYTIAQLVGQEPPDEWQGRNLLTDREEAHLYFFSLFRRPVFGLRDGNYKYHFYINSGKQELFDLSKDPQEKKNLADRHPELCKEYRRKVAGFVRYQKQYLAERGAQ